MYNGITSRMKGANGMPWDVMPKWWVSGKDPFTLLHFDADWAWRVATPKTVLSRAQGGLVETLANELE